MAKKRKDSKIFDNIRTAFDSHAVDEWRRNSDRLRGYLSGDWGRATENTKYVVNTMYNLVNLITPNLFYQSPWIRVNPTKKFVIKKLEDGGYQFIEASRSATLLEHVVNNTIKKMDMEEQWRKCVQDALVYGMGVLKIGYNFSEGQGEENVGVEPEEEIFCQRICPLDFGWDPMANGPDDAAFLIHRVTRSLEDVQADPNLKNTEDLQGMDLSDDSPKRKKKEDSKAGGDYVELFEYHDLRTNEIITVAKDCAKTDSMVGSKLGKKSEKQFRTLWRRKNPHDFKNHFIVLRFTGDNDKFVPPPMLGMVEDECLALNEVTSLMINHYRMFPGVIIHEQGALDDDEIDAFESGEQGSMLQVQPGAIGNNRVQRTPPLPMGNEYFAGVNTLGGMIDKVIGVPDFQRQVSTKRKTATEVATESQDSAIRRAYFLNFVKRFVLQTVTKIVKLIQQYYDEDKEIRITGDFDEFWTWNKSDIAGEFDFDLDVESMRVYSSQRAQGIINALNVLSQYPILQPVLMKIDPDLLAEELFKNLDVNFEAIKKQRSISHIEYDPNEENSLAEQGRRIHDPAPGEDHATHAMLHNPKIQELLGTGKVAEAQELARHAQMHQFIQQAAGMMPGQASPMQPPAGLGGAMGGPAPAGGAAQGQMGQGPVGATSGVPAPNMAQGG